MINTKQIFEIIRFTADNQQYYPASLGSPSWMGENDVAHTEMNILLGQSRYGGAIVDLPNGSEYPEDLCFAAQLDLTQFSPFDKSGLLPKTGQLIFFADIMNDKGKVIYTDTPNEKLVRVIKEHEDNFFSGVLIQDIFADTETFDERFREPEDEYEQEEMNENGQVWDSFIGCNTSKIFGIYTNCQSGQEEVEYITFSDRTILLQIGENGFNDEGVFTVLISKEDLKNLNFENCEFIWAQS